MIGVKIATSAIGELAVKEKHDIIIASDASDDYSLFELIYHNAASSAQSLVVQIVAAVITSSQAMIIFYLSSYITTPRQVLKALSLKCLRL